MKAAWPAPTWHPHLPTALAVFTRPGAQQIGLHKLGAVLPPKESAPRLKPCVHFEAAQCKKDGLISECVQRRADKMVKGLKGKPYEWLRSLCFFSLEKWRLRGALITADNFLKGDSASREGADLLWWAAIGYKEMGWSHVRGISDWTLGKCSSLRGWLVTGTGFPGKWSGSQACQSSRST